MFKYIYKIVDNDNSPDNYESLKISIRSIKKNSEMLRFVHDHLKIKNMCQITVKNFSFVIKHVCNHIRLNKCVVKLF